MLWSVYHVFKSAILNYLCRKKSCLFNKGTWPCKACDIMHAMPFGWHHTNVARKRPQITWFPVISLGRLLTKWQETHYHICRVWVITSNMSLLMRKPVFGVCDQVRLKPACSATETSRRLEILDIETRGIILSKQRITKALIRLRGCAGWSAPLLFACGKTGFLMTRLI